MLIGLLICPLSGCAASRQDESSVEPSAVHAVSAQAEQRPGVSFGRIEVDGRSLDYALHVPTAPAPEGGRSLLVCLHGAGFTGKAYLERWVSRLGDDYVLVCPTFTREDSDSEIWAHWWSQPAEDFVLALIDQLCRERSIDRERIVLAGMSNGGVGVYHLALRHPDLFSAVVPMAGALPPADWQRLGNLTGSSVYLIHGAADNVMPVEDSDRVAAALEEFDLDLTYVRHDWVHPMAGGHFFPRQALPELITWLDGRQRRAFPATVSLHLDKPHARRYWWLEPLDVGEEWSIEAGQLHNQIHIDTSGVGTLQIYLSREWIDFEQPVLITVNGRVRFSERVDPDPELRRSSEDGAQLGTSPHDAVLLISEI